MIPRLGIIALVIRVLEKWSIERESESEVKNGANQLGVLSIKDQFISNWTVWFSLLLSLGFFLRRTPFYVLPT